MTEKAHRKVVIVGGGITGMAAAYTIQQEARAAEQPVTFILVEAAQRLGGKIVTEQFDGLTVEGGPDCFIRQKPWASDLALELGLEDELIGTNDHQRKVWVLSHGKLAQLPDGVMLIVPTRIMPFVTSNLISWPGKIRMGLDLLIRPYTGDDDESIGSFVRRRLGSEALDKIAEPLMSGIHVSDPEQQSLLATFPRFRNIEKKHGSLIKGMLAERKHAAKNGKSPQAPSKVPSTLFVSLKNGLGKLVETLEAHLTGGEILRGVKVESLKRLEGGRYQVQLDDGQKLLADAVVVAAPAYAAAELMLKTAPEVSSMLDKIRYVSTATVSLAFRKRDLQKPLTGHGMVVPKKENRLISACTMTSLKFNHRSPDDTILLRCFVGGPGKEGQVDLLDEQILDLVRGELKTIFSIDAAPFAWRIFRWHKANPQYDVGHVDRMKILRTMLEQHPGVYLTGSAYDGVGVPDCIHQGQNTARMVMDYLQQLESQSFQVKNEEDEGAFQNA